MLCTFWLSHDFPLISSLVWILKSLQGLKTQKVLRVMFDLTSMHYIIVKLIIIQIIYCYTNIPKMQF